MMLMPEYVYIVLNEWMFRHAHCAYTIWRCYIHE